MTLTPPIKWHGGKHYLAKKIVGLMPKHTHYVEPYFGGGAVLLAKDPDGVSEVVNDLNGTLMTFWEVLRDTELFGQFKRMCEATPFSQELWERAFLELENHAQLLHEDPVVVAHLFFVAARQSMAGRMKDFTPLSRTRTRRGMNEQASAWLTAVEGLSAVHARLQRVVILSGNALDVIKAQDGQDTLFYLDPPYLHDTRKSTGEYGDFEMDEAGHAELLKTINRCSGKVMLSGYPSDLYYRELGGWRLHKFDLPNNAAGGDTKRRMTECLWCNF